MFVGLNIGLTGVVVDLRSTWATSQLRAQKKKKKKKKLLQNHYLLYFFKKRFSYISGNGLSSPKLEKLLHFFQNFFFLFFRRELAKPEKQKFCIFWEIKFSSPKSKKFLIFFF